MHFEHIKEQKETQLISINNTITTLLIFRKKIKNQLPKLEGGGAGHSKAKTQKYDENAILMEIDELLLKNQNYL